MITALHLVTRQTRIDNLATATPTACGRLLFLKLGSLNHLFAPQLVPARAGERAVVGISDFIPIPVPAARLTGSASVPPLPSIMAFCPSGLNSDSALPGLGTL